MRRAFNFAIDFEEMNRQMFFGQYKRIKATLKVRSSPPGLPRGRGARDPGDRARQGAGRSCSPCRTPTRSAVTGKVRNNLREATRLLREAGYEMRDQKLVNAKTGEPLSGEILIISRTGSASCCATSRRWSGSALSVAPHCR